MSFSSLGTKLSIVAGAPTTFDDDQTDGYPSLTYELVGEVGNISNFGGSRSIVEFTPVDTGVVDKHSGPINYGSLSGDLARDASDAGQTVLQEGLDGTEAGNVHSIVLEDPNGDKIYTAGIVETYDFNPGSADSIFGGSFSIALKKKPLPVSGA